MPRVLRSLRTLCLCCLLLPFAGAAQSLGQPLRGQVRSARTGQALPGAVVQLIGSGQGSLADSSGHFSIADVPIGRHQLRASHLGYEPLLLSELLVESGKETVLQLALRPATQVLSDVEVTASRSGLPPTQPLSVQAISIDQVRRFPASFYDPARLAAAYPGVANTNDQANGLSIRGHSPDHLAWQLEGLQILNPNHTPNAGTFADRTTLSSGGVNMLSAQLLATSRLYTGGFSASHGNALGGVMDMRLRSGNEQQYEFTAQAGLIGVDVAAEGPFRRGGKSSFLVNYRYSTVGLLSQAGLDFGDEAINFQDLSFHLVFPGERGQRLSVFGLLGRSSNRFEGPQVPEERETGKDLFDIDFQSGMGAGGLTWRMPVGQQGFWFAAAGLSALEQERFARPLDADLEAQLPRRLLEDDSQLWLLSGHSYYQQGFSGGLQLQVGVQLRAFRHRDDFSGLAAAQRRRSVSILSPYGQLSGRLGTRWAYEAGLHLPIYCSPSAALAEPRFSLTYQLRPQHQLSGAYGLHSQLSSPYFRGFGELAPTRAHQWGLAYEWQLRPALSLKGELFYHRLFDAPVVETEGFGAFTPLSELNAWTWLPSTLSEASAQGDQYGIELGIEQMLAADFYYLANLTLYRASYTLPGRAEALPSRFDGRIMANATAGKEWLSARPPEKTRTWGLNLRFNYLGGFREAPIDEAASRAAQYTVLDFSSGYTHALPNLFRTDLRVYWKRSRPERSATLALDIQNLTNRRNAAFTYYDILLDEPQQAFQLSLIPILTYRIDF